MSVVYSSLADQIVLQSGDIIHGQIIEENEETLIVKHRDFGTLRIPADRIQQFTIQSGNEKQPDLECYDVKRQIELTAPDSEEDMEIFVGKGYLSQQEKVLETDTAMPEYNKYGAWTASMKEQGWKFSTSLTFDSSWGNTEEDSMRFGLRFEQEQETKRRQTDLTYYYKANRNETTDNKLTLGNRRD